MKFLRFLALSAIILGGICSALAINNTLMQANSLYNRGEYQRALKQYSLAYKDPGYKPSDSKAIVNGMNKCKAKMGKPNPDSGRKQNLDKPKPQVAVKASINGSTSPSITLDPAGGSRIITVANATDWPDVADTPDWLAVDVISDDEIELSWDSNSTRKSRNKTFRVYAGGDPIRVSVSQGAYRSNELQISGITYKNALHGQDLSKGRPLYADEMRFLCPTLIYEGGKKDVTKYVKTKIFEPNGNLRHSRTSPEGYSTGTEIEFYEFDDSEDQTAPLPQLGRSDVSTFSAGQYTIEVYISDDLNDDSNDQLLLIDKLYIRSKDGETSFLNVNGKDLQEAFFDNEGESLTFNIQTDGDWSMTNVPKWCRAYMDGDELVVTAEPNPYSEFRYATMDVISGDRKVPIRLQQAGN